MKISFAVWRSIRSSRIQHHQPRGAHRAAAAMDLSIRLDELVRPLGQPMVIPTAAGGAHVRPLQQPVMDFPLLAASSRASRVNKLARGFSSGHSTESQTHPIPQPVRFFKHEDSKHSSAGVGTPTWPLKEPTVGFLSSGRFNRGWSRRPGGPGAHNLSLARGFSSGDSTKSQALPVLQQARFFTPEDYEHSSWLDFIRFMNTYPAISDVRLNPLLHEQHERVTKPIMLSGAGRIMWHSLIELVYCNKLREYDIARALLEGNLKVSKIYGTVALIDPTKAEAYDGSKPFMGFKAVRTLFIRVMKNVYGMGILELFSDDIPHLLSTLDNPTDDRLCLYHAALLSPLGRALLSIRLNSIFRDEVNLEGFLWKKEDIHAVMEKLPYTSSDPGKEKTDTMHAFFKHWRDVGENRKAKGTNLNYP
ncbi:hypothetical protein EJB05_38864 [Eragrostis curvula]|uniref:Uncharacterized protein n=1 Tax=Eragrostis curvula TaxID=38414 RepID=A0A5J9TVE8_9POAL|nr:hypothetical protein EJB05_38864 [Eragrostis curvula]